MTEDIKLDPTWLTVYEVDGSRIFVKAEEEKNIIEAVGAYHRNGGKRDWPQGMKTVEGTTYTILVSRIIGWMVTTEKSRAYSKRADEEFTTKEEPWE